VKFCGYFTKSVGKVTAIVTVKVTRQNICKDVGKAYKIS
jgi:hypothetical protein